jgi:nucleoside-diphosphate-sugar epimerase
VTTTRREFLKTAGMAGGVLGLGLTVRPASGATLRSRPRTGTTAPVERAPKPLRILILGGTGFIGPHQVRYAVARGHKVTVFNRGRRQADLPKEVEHLQGDRNGQLDSLKGKKWDVVIDNPTTLPKWVRDAGQVLKGNTGQYIFISTISTYDGYPKPGMDETSALLQYKGADAFAEPVESARQQYGQLKVLSEKEAETWFPGKTTVIRPGLIVGPGDETDRFSYWPVRIDRGGEVLAPGDGTDPVQVIDVRDLTEWTIRMAEQGDLGIYNATGPRRPMSMAEQLYGIRAVTPGSNDVSFTWVPSDFLAEQKVRGWSDMPTWVPKREGNDGWSRVSIERAVAKGLTFRPLAVTARDTIDWFKTLPAERTPMRSGLAPEREKAVLEAWHAKR